MCWKISRFYDQISILVAKRPFWFDKNKNKNKNKYFLVALGHSETPECPLPSEGSACLSGFPSLPLLSHLPWVLHVSCPGITEVPKTRFCFRPIWIAAPQHTSNQTPFSIPACTFSAGGVSWLSSGRLQSSDCPLSVCFHLQRPEGRGGKLLTTGLMRMYLHL